MGDKCNTMLWTANTHCDGLWRPDKYHFGLIIHPHSADWAIWASFLIIGKNTKAEQSHVIILTIQFYGNTKTKKKGVCISSWGAVPGDWSNTQDSTSETTLTHVPRGQQQLQNTLGVLKNLFLTDFIVQEGKQV